VTTAASAAEGWTALERRACLLLVDIAMPGDDGYSLGRTLLARGCARATVTT
jgi:CheY-like chemotaxis protein